MRRKQPLLNRFFANVRVQPNGCWMWQGLQSPRGFGRLFVNGKASYAHRVSWTLHVGPIPGSILVYQSCGNHACVNPEHLRLKTLSDHVQLLVEVSHRRRRAYCANGHPFDKCAKDRHGVRQVCSRCNNAISARYKARKKEQRGLEILAVIREAVPRTLPAVVREEVQQELAVMILKKKIDLDSVAKAVPAFITTVFRKYPSRYGPLSIDQPWPGSDGQWTLKEVLPA